ncbi:MAG TPA: YkgJ family cysteine cluster protein [Methanoregula sp.]|nr:YkgJ family cysteine cluster protein [Methanoregula sp.]
MDGEPEEDEPCAQCGLCCRIFGPQIAPTPENLFIWMEQGRTDILRWFVATLEDGTSVTCTDLRAGDLVNLVSAGLRDPGTGGYVTVCPFLRRVAKGRYLCGIHPVKPEMCCTYQPWVWGETYFNRCPSLKAGRKCRWPL